MISAKIPAITFVAAFGFFHASAQTLTLTLDSVTPEVAPGASLNDFATVDGNSGDSMFSNYIVGMPNFTITSQTGLSDNYPTEISLFCMEMAQDITLGSTGNVYTLEDLQYGSSGIGTGLAANIGLTGIGSRRAANLEILYAHVFGASYDTSLLGTNAEVEGFQLAVWKLSQDDGFDISRPADPSKNYWITGIGSLTDTGAVAQAQAYLTWVKDHPNGAMMALDALSSPTVQDFIIPVAAVLVPIPEPRFYATVLGCMVLGVAIIFRRSLRRSANAA